MKLKEIDVGHFLKENAIYGHMKGNKQELS